MWGDAAEVSSPEAPAPPYFLELLAALARQGLQPDRTLSVYIRRRIELTGAAELRKLTFLDPHRSDAADFARRLGWGFAIAEFLTLPVPVSDLERDRACSLGALINLMVVTCDRLLDAGEKVRDVLPVHQIATGGDASLPMLLLREYFNRLSLLGPDQKLLRTIKKIVSRMFAAEIETVSPGSSLPYRFWLRKCSLPFVLMGLSACAFPSSRQTASSFRYLLWLHRLGRFFGAVDDAIDFHEDIENGHPNYWQAYNERARPPLVPRVANWGVAVLSQWEAIAPASRRSIPRQTFLHTVWGW